MTQNKPYLMALDQGTTSSRAIIFDQQGKIVSIAQKDFKQHFPQAGWVEHDPKEIWSSQSAMMIESLVNKNIKAKQVAAIGITNQRETTIIWDRESGEPIYNAIVWQDRRTAGFCNALKERGEAERIVSKTGLIIDAYFSATKIKWILDHVDGARSKAEAGELAFGTVDSWLIWNLTSGKTHITDITNASRTMLFNIHTQEWDQELLDLFDIPSSLLPEVKSCSEIYCETAGDVLSEKIPIAGIAGDQQAALFGQLCTQPGMAKTTYGTGCFLVMNTGKEAVRSENQLLTTIAWKIGDEINYALEGSVFIGGAAIQWLRDGMGIFKHARESERMADSIEGNDGVYFVPALSGLGAPHWDQDARGAFFGITRGTTKAHMARAALEAIAYQVYDVLKAMEKDSGKPTRELRVDGGATANSFLMQFQADLLSCEIKRPQIIETTAIGAAFLAGLAVGFWKDQEEIKSLWKADRSFVPHMGDPERDRLIHFWHKAVERSKNWVE
ncbi:glycerol kinase GlpK [Algoriphagus halophytocola]|uniref:Glycerol kinase n=1 Tax=Algoriphagus halophytocola TaxID=2991499 RepID=A0ABY6MCD9_9BACT|nr:MULTISPECIES: glycerol kinase GlpK [unclassified Algoriphagus]UZD21123.1 glycerol kinase GlpK [Algoriphagus sp. TR-M5]WBL42292.1 glycerol kinase GlpK [Algoriphagus sp. TR-M9]